MWTLTYSVEGCRHVEVIPHDQIAQLEPLVKRCREHLDALRELGAINAQLLHLWRLEQRSRKPAKPIREAKSTRRKSRRRPRSLSK